MIRTPQYKNLGKGGLKENLLLKCLNVYIRKKKYFKLMTILVNNDIVLINTVLEVVASGEKKKEY